MAQQKLTVVVDGLDQNLSLADCEVVEAILAFAIPIDGVVWIGCCLMQVSKNDPGPTIEYSKDQKYSKGKARTALHGTAKISRAGHA